MEYVWVGGKNEIRSKTKIFPSFLHFSLEHIPIWNYDGSSTWQANSDGDTEVILVPCALFHNPLRVVNNCASYIVLCDTYKPDGTKLDNNYLNNTKKKSHGLVWSKNFLLNSMKQVIKIWKNMYQVITMDIIIVELHEIKRRE